ncbi:hypothetical protein GQ600_896 [Phytophthora cactorum]|nr:hypothetical protein GQ600_896 [Phytophthora cactorum]
MQSHRQVAAEDGGRISSAIAMRPLATAAAAVTTLRAETRDTFRRKESEDTKKMKRSRAPSPTRTAKDFAAANAAIAAAAAGSNGLPSDVKKPTKKRIRRQREELLYLRVKVQEMESSLAELKGKETRTRSPTGSSTQLAVNGKPSSEGSSLLASVWESLANRQYKDRERAEQENRKLKSTLEGQIKLAKCLEKILEDQSEDDHETSSKNTVARTFGHKIQSERGSLDYRSESVLECRKRGDRVVIVTRGLAKPIKFSAAPVNGIRFHENGWIVIEKASAKDGSAKGKWATIASSMELKPIFDDDASDQDFTVGALTDFVIDSFHRNMHLGEEVVAAIMTDEARKAATQPAGSWPYSYVSDDPSRLSVDDVLGLIDWKELENVLSSPDDTSRPPIHVDLPMDVQPVPIAPNAKPAPPRRTRKSSRSSAAKTQTQTQTQTPTAAQQPTAAPPAGPPVKKKRIRREIVELKFLRGKVKELEEELRKLQLGFSTSPRADGEPVPLDGLMPSVWTSMAGRQLKDRMRAERENQELRNMLQDQLKIAQGLEDTLKQLPPSQVSIKRAQIDRPSVFRVLTMVHCSETLAESLTHLERTYLSVDEALATEGVDYLEMDKHEIKAILHPAYGTCIRFTTRIAMPFNYEITSRAMWRFITEEGLISLASSFNVSIDNCQTIHYPRCISNCICQCLIQKIYTTKDIQAHCFAIRLPESEPAKDYWLNQVVRKHLETDRMVVVGRSTVHPYVKDSSHPTGVSFIDDARLTVNDCSSNGVPQTCVKVCVYLVPDFGSSSSNETVGSTSCWISSSNLPAPVKVGILQSGTGLLFALDVVVEAFSIGATDYSVRPTFADGDLRADSAFHQFSRETWCRSEKTRECKFAFFGHEEIQELQQRVRANANHKFWDFSMEAVDEVFSEQLVTIAKLHLEAQQRQSPSWSVHLGSELSMGRDIAKLDASVKAGVVLEPRCGVVLPFQLEVATDAYWRFFRFDHSGKHFADQAPAHSTNLFARSFAVQTELKGYTSETEGKYTCRKYVGEDEATLVWSGMWNILSFGGVRFDGMQLHKQSFIKLRRVSKHGAGLSSTSTLVETSFETIPVFHDSVCDFEEQIKILITSLNQSHATMNDHFCHLMSDLLLEEDWKSTFRRGNVGSFEDNLYSCSLTASTSAFERTKEKSSSIKSDVRLSSVKRCGNNTFDPRSVNDGYNPGCIPNSSSKAEVVDLCAVSHFEQTRKCTHLDSRPGSASCVEHVSLRKMEPPCRTGCGELTDVAATLDFIKNWDDFGAKFEIQDVNISSISFADL